MRHGTAIRDVLYAAGGMPGDRAVFGAVTLDGFARAFGSSGRGMAADMSLAVVLDSYGMSGLMAGVPMGGQRRRGRGQPTGQHERRSRIEKTHEYSRENFESIFRVA
jgi:hypothetical protein